MSILFLIRSNIARGYFLTETVRNWREKGRCGERFFEERGKGAGDARRVEDGGYGRRGGAIREKKSSVRAGCRIRNRRRREGKLSGNVIIPFVSPVDTALDDFGRIAGNYDVRFIKFCGNAAVPTDN